MAKKKKKNTNTSNAVSGMLEDPQHTGIAGTDEVVFKVSKEVMRAAESLRKAEKSLQYIVKQHAKELEELHMTQRNAHNALKGEIYRVPKEAKTAKKETQTNAQKQYEAAVASLKTIKQDAIEEANVTFKANREEFLATYKAANKGADIAYHEAIQSRVESREKELEDFVHGQGVALTGALNTMDRKREELEYQVTKTQDAVDAAELLASKEETKEINEQAAIQTSEKATPAQASA